jgi:hypothetical protein
MSVSDTTPVKRPEMRAPGRAAAETGKALLSGGDVGFELASTAWVMDGVAKGVAGWEGDGDADSTTHILWLRVATNLATVWARVE